MSDLLVLVLRGGIGLLTLSVSKVVLAEPPAAGLACTVAAGGCDVVLAANSAGDIVLIETNQPPARFAGKKLCIPAGNYRSLFSNALQGLSDAPVTITNCGSGKATFSNNGGSAVTFYNARYIRFTGSGDPDTRYGIVAHNSNASGQGYMVEFTRGSSDIEVNRVEAKGNPVTFDANGVPILTGGTGISIKTYPDCATGNWRRGTFTQYNTRVHDNYVHDTANEGMYLGTSHNGWVVANSYTPGFFCSSTNQTWIEADLINVVVTNNRVENTGNDAIQVGGSLEWTQINNNVIRSYGMRSTPALDFHAAGIQIGNGTKATVNANWIENGAPVAWASQGIKYQGLGGSFITNNVVVNARVGLMLLRNTDVNLALDLPHTHIYNNTVVSSTAEAIYMLCSNLKTVFLRNNLITSYASAYVSGNGGTACVPGIAGDNLFFPSLASAGYVAAAQNDFHLNANSPAASNGVNLSGVVDSDFDGLPRTGSYSFGAYRAPSAEVIFANGFQ
ncbi:MAG: right-handed parallel beta-helix repeat-containing protein [Rhodanobacteraceae bacterium]|nr:right-handed parallel beta-helix repeat-containing protein [Rhodanobacteraceae bacterium]